MIFIFFIFQRSDFSTIFGNGQHLTKWLLLLGKCYLTQFLQEITLLSIMFSKEKFRLLVGYVMVKFRKRDASILSCRWVLKGGV